jgi:hypothetical protein
VTFKYTDTDKLSHKLLFVQIQVILRQDDPHRRDQDEVMVVTLLHVNVVVFYNKLLWFVSELLEKDISNVVVQCR